SSYSGCAPMARRTVSEDVRSRISTFQPERSALSMRSVYWMDGLTSGCAGATRARIRASEFMAIGWQWLLVRLNHVGAQHAAPLPISLTIFICPCLHSPGSLPNHISNAAACAVLQRHTVTAILGPCTAGPSKT